jgi:phage-related protein
LDITFNGKNIKELGLKVKRSNHLDSFENDMELHPVAGRNGDLIIDNGNYRNKDIEIVSNLDCRDKDTKAITTSINYHFKSMPGYGYLKFSDGYEFMAVCKGQIVYNELFNDYYEVSIVFSVKGVND